MNRYSDREKFNIVKHAMILKFAGSDIISFLVNAGIIAGVTVGGVLGVNALGSRLRKRHERQRDERDRRYAKEFIMGKTSSESKEHQQRVLDKLRRTNSLLIYHGMGSGKTLTSILAGRQEGLPMTVIGPASLRYNYPKEMKKHNVVIPLGYYSYNKPPEDRKHGLLVFDEAHQMGRTESQRSKYPDIYSGQKTLFMTGTPIRNRPSELIPLMRGLGINIPRDETAFKKYFISEKKKYPNIFARIMGVEPGMERHGKNLDLILEAIKGKVDYHEDRSGEYPAVEEEDINVDMTKRQYNTYKELAKGYPGLAYKIKHGLPPSKRESRRLNAFLSASRQISNTARPFNMSATEEDEPKLNKIVEEISEHTKNDENYRGVTYSNYLNAGLDPISERLSKLDIPYAKFTGKLSPKEKNEIIRKYNSGLIKHLLVSSSGAEGLDLKGTKLMQILEPHWHESKLDQVKARAIRIGSHSHLPEEEHVVKVQNYYSIPPSGVLGRKRGGADQFLHMLSEEKRKLNQEFLDILRKASGGDEPEDGSIKSAMRQFPISIANQAAIKLDHVVWPWIKLREAIPIFSKTKTNALKQYAWLKREQADRIKDIYRGLANKQPVGEML